MPKKWSNDTSVFTYPDGKPKAVYVQLSPSTFRYKRLIELSQEFNCSYHRIVLEAIDWYLRTQTPKRN
jgi:hypothetical protein